MSVRKSSVSAIDSSRSNAKPQSCASTIPPFHSCLACSILKSVSRKEAKRKQKRKRRGSKTLNGDSTTTTTTAEPQTMNEENEYDLDLEETHIDFELA